jgi:ubiquinone/menaquinone biosynthesis C-methylase UbiE/uncharacterized protein YbaR (Trm112 family)
MVDGMSQESTGRMFRMVTRMLWSFACPACHAALQTVDADELRCPACSATYPKRDGIWRMLAEERREVLREFVEQYETVRKGEARIVQGPRHLRALPFRDLSRTRRYEWFVRSKSFRTLIERVVSPLERERGAPLRILDGGSGLGWLAYRLAMRGHEVAAIDLTTNDFDGLGVHRQYDRYFLPVQAEFDRLPFRDGSVDLVIYNASFHYSADYSTTLREGLRVLDREGRVVIMDSPLYRDPSSGTAMLHQRDEAFERQYGFRGAYTEGFLTYERLAALQDELSLTWELFEPWYGVRWWLKPRMARVRALREPARFKLVVGRRLGEPRPASSDDSFRRAARRVEVALPRVVRPAVLVWRHLRRMFRARLPARRLTPDDAYRLWSETYDAEPDNVMLDVERGVFDQLIARARVADKIVVDIGCGTGRYWERILSLRPRQLQGIDGSPEMLARLRARHPDAMVRVRSGIRISELGASSVDLIVSTLTLGYVKDVHAELREWTRLLRVGGEIVVTDVHPEALSAGMKRTFDHRGVTFEIEHTTHSADALRSMFRELHLEILQIEERMLDPALRTTFERNDYLDGYRRVAGVPLVLGFHLRRIE